MTILICDDKFKLVSFRAEHVFEYKPQDNWETWGISVTKGSTDRAGHYVKLYRIELFFGGNQLFDVHVHETDEFFHRFKELLKTRSVASIQHTIKLSEEVVAYAFEKMIHKPNFPSSLSVLLREIYEAGVARGEEAVSLKIKSALKID